MFIVSCFFMKHFADKVSVTLCECTLLNALSPSPKNRSAEYKDAKPDGKHCPEY